MAFEFRDTVTGHEHRATAHQITPGPSPVVVQCPLDATNRFYRGAWVP